jgi:hypothetical protein
MSTATRTAATIERKHGFDWDSLKAKVEAEHWKKLLITFKLRDKLHAGKPAQLDAAKAMLAARGLGDLVDAREQERPAEDRAEEVVDEGLCEFHRREGKPGVWWPSNNLKACIKENWSVLGYRMDARPRGARKSEAAGEEGGKKLQGSRGAIHEGLFVVSTDPEDRDWLRLGDEPAGIDQSVAHTIGPKGPRSSIKRNEYVQGTTLTCEVWIARAVSLKLPDESFADMLLHAQEHGIGANRSQGIGKFDVVSVKEI